MTQKYFPFFLLCNLFCITFVEKGTERVKDKQNSNPNKPPIIMAQETVKFTASGERVELTGETRNLVHGLQYEVIYSDGSKGWEHKEDLLD